MSIWNDFTGGAQNDINNGYNNAQGYLNPYSQGGSAAFNQWRNNTSNYGNMLDQYGNPADYMWRSANQSPQQYYQNIMTGYQQSPQAAYAQQQAARAGNAAAAASGMMGSGAYMNGMQRNANQISQGDQQQYFNNVMSSNQAQMQSIDDFQRQQQWYNQMLAQQAGMGLQAAGQQSQNSMQRGAQDAYWDNQGLNNMAGIAGMGAQIYHNW